MLMAVILITKTMPTKAVVAISHFTSSMRLNVLRYFDDMLGKP